MTNGNALSTTQSTQPSTFTNDNILTFLCQNSFHFMFICQKQTKRVSCENPKWDGLKTVSNEYHKPPLLTLPELFLSPVYMCFQMSGNSVPMSCPPSPLPVRYNLKLTWFLHALWSHVNVLWAQARFHVHISLWAKDPHTLPVHIWKFYISIMLLSVS